MRRSCAWFLVLLVAAAMICLGRPLPGAAQGESWQQSWFKVYGGRNETLNPLPSGDPIETGYLVGTAALRTEDGNLLAAAYTRPTAGRPVDLALLKVRPDGGVVWFKEYASPRPRKWLGRVNAQDQFTWASLIATSDGGAALVFDSVLLKIDGQGNPLWSTQYLNPVKDKHGAAYRDFILKSVVQVQDGFVLCGVYPNHPILQRQADSVVLIRVDNQGGLIGACEYPNLGRRNRPQLRLTGQGKLILGANPLALLELDLDGRVIWSKALASEKFERGNPRRPDRGKLLWSQSLELADNGDILFSGAYDLSSGSYSAPGSLICRLSQAGGLIWSKRIHSPTHGGETLVQGLASAGEDIYLVGRSSEFGATEDRMNENALVMKMSGGGDLSWIRSLGRKKKSGGQAEYARDRAISLAVTGDGGLFAVGTTDSFSHPLPWIRQVREWPKPHYDLLLARLGPDGSINNLAAGRYPRLLSIADPGDEKKVEVLSPPISVRDLTVERRDLAVTVEPADYRLAESAGLAIRYSTPFPGMTNRLPVADFKVLPPFSDGTLKARLDGSLSSDPDGGTIVAYDWEFKPAGGTATGQAVEHEFPRAGGWEVSLTAYDEQWNASTPTTKTVLIGHVLRGHNVEPALACGELVGYEVEVTTGDLPDAGTNAGVYLSLFGPEDEQGRRCGSMDMWLYDTVSENYDDPFERGQLDAWRHHPGSTGLGRFFNLDEIEYAILRHDNSDDKPGWFVQGFRVFNQSSNKEWYFIPQQWLADDEPPDKRTWGKFYPVQPYQRGLFFGGQERSRGLTEASDNVFILPAGVEQFHFTLLDRGGQLEVYRNGFREGFQAPGGQGQVRPPYIKQADWGIAYQAAQITAPTQFTVKVKSGGRWREGAVWVFPSNWAGRESTARKAAVLYPLKDRTAGIFSYGENAQKYMQDLEVDLEAALASIIEYGSEAIGIFGDIPDTKLISYVKPAVRQFLENKLIAITASKSVNLALDTVSTIETILTSLLNAAEWGSQASSVTDDALAHVNAAPLLQQMAGYQIPRGEYIEDSSFVDCVKMMSALGPKVDQLIQKLEANDPAGCESVLQEIKGLVLGDIADVTSEQIQALAQDPQAYEIDYSQYGVIGRGSGYPLFLELVLQLRLARQVWGDADDDTYAPYFGRWMEGRLSQSEKKNASVLAMETFEPILENMLQAISMIVDVCLLQ